MKIALIIPSWIEDKERIPFLLESIEKQTRKPDIVVLCISSIPLDMEISFPGFSLPLQIEKTEKQHTAAQNRNRGILLVKEDYDILSFMDSDDHMHPQRLEYIERAFQESNYSGIVHGYHADMIENFKGWNMYNEFSITQKSKNDLKVCQNGHISILSSVTNDLIYPTDKLTIGKEDTLFIQNMEDLGFTIGIIELPLSFYRQYNYEEKIDRDYHLFMLRGGVF